MKKAIEVLLVAGIGLLSCEIGSVEAKEIKWEKDNSVMVYIPAGEFTMGSNSGDVDEKPPHRVYLDAYYIDKYEVTNEQFARFLNEWGKDTDENGKKVFYEHKWGIKKVASRFVVWTRLYEKYPVIYVTWYGANQYAKWARKRLPTEAEWEKACRAGSKGIYCFGDDESFLDKYDESILDKYAWYKQNSGRRTHPVGHKMPNAWGIHDMHGNLEEWCADRYGKNYYKNSPYKNPYCPSSVGPCVIRGGSCASDAGGCRSANRVRVAPVNRWGDSGFRCAVSASEVGKKK